MRLTLLTLPLLVALPLLFCLPGCSHATPCSESGDTSWNWPRGYEESDPDGIKRVATCNRYMRPDGSYVDNGPYSERFASGKVALQGSFDNGVKDGTWTQYGYDGQVVERRYFKKGVELPKPANSKPTNAKVK